jgi:hypothetical protein
MSELNTSDKYDTQHAPLHEEPNMKDIDRENQVQKDPDFSGQAARVQSLGSVRLRNATTGEVVLVPTPTKDPNDPLVCAPRSSKLTCQNWSRTHKYMVTVLVCFAIFLCNFLAAGPVIAIVEIAMTFFPQETNPDLGGSISKVAYFFTTTALMQVNL